MSEWISVKERLPECEQEVLINAVRKCRWDETRTYNIITTAFYEDGKMLEVNSKWRWEDIDYAGWNEEEDCGIIPEGWWEYRHYNPDEVYNNCVDDFIIAWMPLPEPYREDGDTDEIDN